MGNCQAIDAASLVIQHPSGRVERMYWPVTAKEVMRLNKGFYVALVINFMSNEEKNEHKIENSEVNITRVKLLRPADTLLLGQSYRLITSEEVMKGLWAKKYAKKKKKEAATEAETQVIDKEQKVMEKKDSGCETESKSDSDEVNQPTTKREKQRPKTASSALARARAWRPSLQSISEATS